jgi:chlorobactene glucosyltransferase
MSLVALVDIYGAVCFAAGIYFAFVTVSNILWLMHSTFVDPVTTGPKVSVLIPARNEEAHIGACLNSLLAQDYDNFDITVLDDESTDRTSAILRSYARRSHGKIHMMHSGPLTPGWYGKPRAMHNLSKNADGEYLLFVDADTIHERSSIGKAVALAQRHKADLVSGYVRHVTKTFGETAVVPSIYILTTHIMPLWLIPFTKSSAISHAIGQFMFFKTSKYREIGGYEAVKDQVTEDVRIARIMKKAGGKIFFGDFKAHVSCRMYTCYKDALAGISKNVFDYFNKNFFVLLGGTIAVPLIFFVPIISIFWLPTILAPIRPLLHTSLILTFSAWVFTTIERMLPWYTPFLYPLILVNVLSMAWRAFRVLLLGGAIEWKGRMVK